MTLTEVGHDCSIDRTVELGYGATDTRTVVGDEARIRSGSIIYGGVTVGDDFVTGHDVLVREGTHIGDGVLLGSKTIVEGQTTIGSKVSVQSRVYIPTESTIGDNVFIGPGSVLTNDSYPLRRDGALEGPTLRDGVSVGGNATILPGVTVGEHAFVAAGAVVTDDIPANRLALGVPARDRPLPPALQSPNQHG